MFQGWQLSDDYNFLVERGSGILDINVLSGECLCDGKPVETLSIVKALLSWFTEDLEKNSIPLNAVNSASLTVKFRASEKVTKNPMKTVRTGFECKSIILSGNDTYESSLSDEQITYVKKRKPDKSINLLNKLNRQIK